MTAGMTGTLTVKHYQVMYFRSGNHKTAALEAQSMHNSSNGFLELNVPASDDKMSSIYI